MDREGGGGSCHNYGGAGERSLTHRGVAAYRSLLTWPLEGTRVRWQAPQSRLPWRLA